jgi:transposase
MIQITPHMRIMLAVEAVDFRKGIDGLAGVCRGILQIDPFTVYLFVFRNRRGTSIKLLLYDSQGFWLCQKRLSKGKFKWWPKETDGVSRTLAAHQLQTLLWNGNPDRTSVSAEWKKIPTIS